MPEDNDQKTLSEPAVMPDARMLRHSALMLLASSARGDAATTLAILERYRGWHTFLLGAVSTLALDALGDLATARGVCMHEILEGELRRAAAPAN